MHLLLANDDGIRAPGILALVHVLSEAGHTVTVCAPDRQRSAAGHAMTMNVALTAEEVDIEGARHAYSISGTPADCVKLGIHELCPDCDMVLSGVNHGYNAGVDVLYSGTVAAAMEGAILGKPAMAVSLGRLREDRYEEAARMAESIIPNLMAHPLPKRSILNLNYPETDTVLGPVAAPLRATQYQEFYRAVAGEGRRRDFLLEGWLDEPCPDGDDDYSWLVRGYATLTVLQADMTEITATDAYRRFFAP